MPSYRKFSVVLLLLAAVALLAACSSKTTTTTTSTTTTSTSTVTVTAPPHPATPATLCPPDASTMGCSIARSQVTGVKLAVPSGAKFPDVSVYQGHPNWAAAKSSIPMAAVKAGEYHEDVDFAWNVAALKRLHIKWAAYWFVRNTGCAHEGAEIVSVLRSVGGPSSLPIVLDMEVPESAGYAPCLANAIHAAFGRSPVIYTSPGTWPGGDHAGLSLWAAAYGPVKPCLWTCPLAWQYTDGKFGARTFIPGIGFGDVSLDFGFSKLVPPPADPHQYARFANGRFPSIWGVLHERNVVKHYDGARQHPAKYHLYLGKLRAELAFLARRVHKEAKTQRIHGKPSWTRYHRGWRYQELIHRAQGHVVTH